MVGKKSNFSVIVTDREWTMQPAAQAGWSAYYDQAP